MPKYEGINLCDDEISPDPELLAWERWVKIRIEETENLGQKLGKPPADLTMNILDNLREDKERKTVLEHAQIPKKPAIRASLWEQPQRLKQRCYCDPVYEVQRTRAELGRPRVIEHIGVPEYIQKTEKGITGDPKRKICVQLDAEYVQYRQKRQKDLKAKIIKLDPHRPEISNLIIKGSKPKTVPKIKVLVPDITISSEIPTYEHVVSAIYALQINNTIFFKEIPGQSLSYLKKLQKMPGHESCCTWSYYFNTPASRAGRAKLYLRNLGTVTLRYCWKKIKKSIPFMPEDINEQVFFFNKNEDVVFPGQSKELSFTFASNKAGIYNESWEFNLSNICFFDTLSNKLAINLNADSTDNIKEMKRKSKVLKNRINRSALKIIARSFIEDCIAKATSLEHQIYPYKNLFLEAELFEMKNPVCFYHQTEVGKMKDLYTEMVPGELWDLSITSWRKVMMDHEFENRMKYYELLRKSHSDILKPWYEGEDLLKEKYRAVTLFLGKLADKFDEESVRIPQMLGVYTQLPEDVNTVTSTTTSIISCDPTTMTLIRNIFYVHMYDHVAATIELCAGVLSSLDLNRWIHFDFCRV